MTLSLANDVMETPFARRLWAFLEAPVDLPCRVACAALASATRAAPELDDTPPANTPEPAASRGTQRSSRGRGRGKGRSGYPKAKSTPSALPTRVPSAAADANKGQQVFRLDRRRLALPHLAFTVLPRPDGLAKAGLFLKWIAHTVDPTFLESLIISEQVPGRVSGKGLSKSVNVLVDLMKHGNVKWTEWILASQQACWGDADAVVDAPLLFRRPDVHASLAPRLQSSQAGWVPSFSEDTPEKPWLACDLVMGANFLKPEIAQVVISARADLTYKDDDGGTVLHHAAMGGNAAFCQVLLSARAEINARDDDEWTPLCLAADSGHASTCEALLRARAGVNLADEDGRSPLWFATKKKHGDVCKLLMMHGGDANQADDHGMAPFMILCGAALDSDSDD
mmetsp:Transcript_8934/g.16909  ORF Transcript_8934/g.16909 Transcript_8934/m.16909 type:complete len:396 (-) Transcript_8934:27-1214(-)